MYKLILLFEGGNQEQLNAETKKMHKLKAALIAVSYEQLVQIKDSFSKEEREIALSNDDRVTVLWATKRRGGGL